MSKGTANFVLLIAALVIVGSLGFALKFAFKTGLVNAPFSSSQPLLTAQPTSQPTPKFAVYTNDKLGFEFQYSDNFSVKEDSEEEFNKRGNGNFRKNFINNVGYEPGKFLGAAAVVDKTDSFDSSPFTVWIFDNPEKLDKERWFENYWYYPFLWGVFDYASKGHVRGENVATISGQTTKYAVVSYQPGSPKYIYVTKEQKMFLLRVIGDPGEKILPTFKII